jgi:hypothetical protein
MTKIGVVFRWCHSDFVYYDYHSLSHVDRINSYRLKTRWAEHVSIGFTSDYKYLNLSQGDVMGGFYMDGKVHISPFYALRPDIIQFRAVAGHELIHAWHEFRGLTVQFSERIAYRYTYRMLQNGGDRINAQIIYNNAIGRGYWGWASLSYRIYPW